MFAAVESRHEMYESNTAVIVNRHGVFVRLYDTIIFGLVKGRKYYSDGGWNTATTASRLQALGCDYHFCKNSRSPRCNDKLRSSFEMINLLCFGRLVK